MKSNFLKSSLTYFILIALMMGFLVPVARASESQITFNHSKTRELVEGLSKHYDLTSAQEMKVQRVVELIDYLQFLQNRVYQLVNKNQELRSFITDHQNVSKKILRSLNEIESETQIETKDSFSIWPIERVEISQIDDELDKLMQSILAIKKQSIKNIASLQQRSRKFVELSSLLKQKEIKRTYPHTPPSRQKSSLKEPLLDEKAAAQVVMLKETIAVLKEEINESKEKIDALTKKLADKTLEVFEKENLAASKIQEYAKLNSALVDAEERLSLVQRIIQEKDRTIEELESYVQEAKVQNEQQDAVNRGQLKALHQQLADLESRLDDQKFNNSDRLASLEDLLAEQELKFATYKNQLKEKELKIHELNTEVVTQGREIQNLRSMMSSKNDKLIELNGIIQIYKGKLADERKRLQAKIHESMLGDKDIAEVEQRLTDSQRITKELYNRIITLQSEFSDEEKGEVQR